MYSTPYSAAPAANAGSFALFGGMMLFVDLAVAILAIVGLWKIFNKAGYSGWKAIIPFYNLSVLCTIAGRPGWWWILFLIPFVNIVVSLVVAMDLAKAFGKSQVFGIVALWLFSVVGYLILGFGDAKYSGNGGNPKLATPTPASKA